RCASTCSVSGASCGKNRANARCSTSWSPRGPARHTPASGAGSTVLTADLVAARRRGDELRIAKLDDETRARAVHIAARLLTIAPAKVGKTREELDGAIGAVDTSAQMAKVRAGLAKLIEDRCAFDTADDAAPAELRHVLFARAAEARRAATFDRAA